MKLRENSCNRPIKMGNKWGLQQAKDCIRIFKLEGLKFKVLGEDSSDFKFKIKKKN